MVLWLLTLLLSPAPSASHLVVALAVVAAALLILLAASGVAVPTQAKPSATGGRRAGPRVLPRLSDPDAAGRPRPRAPSGYPTAA
jgi:uncharacterized protein DUF6412